MTVEELVTLIELRHKLKREISEEEFQDIKPLNSDPAKYDIDVVNEKIVKRYTSCIYNHIGYNYIGDDVEYYCECFINKLKKRGYNIKSYRYLDGGGNVVRYLDGDGNVVSGYSFNTAQQFSVAFTNPN